MFLLCEKGTNKTKYDDFDTRQTTKLNEERKTFITYLVSAAHNTPEHNACSSFTMSSLFSSLCGACISIIDTHTHISQHSTHTHELADIHACI